MEWSAPLIFDIMEELAKSPIRKPVREPKPVQAEAAQNDTPDAVDLGFEIDPTRTYTFETLKKSPTPRNENLGSRARCFDTQEKRYREIGYFPSAPSIFVEEWHETLQEMAPPPLIFYRDIILINGEDIRAMEYMMSHPLYEHSPFRVMNRPAMFTLADKEVQEAIKAKKHAVELKALTAIADTPIADLKPIARIIFGITETSDTAIVNSMNELVKRPKIGVDKMSNAEKVIDNLSNPKLLRTYNLQTAIDTGVITVNENSMEARLTDGNIYLMRFESKKYLNELVDWSFTEKGKSSYNLIKSKI